jgi:hypothetical protein
MKYLLLLAICLGCALDHTRREDAPLLAALESWQKQSLRPLEKLFGPPQKMPGDPVGQNIYGMPLAAPPASALVNGEGKLEFIKVMPNGETPSAIKQVLKAQDWMSTSWDNSTDKTRHSKQVTVKEYSKSLQVFFTYQLGDNKVFYVFFCRDPESPRHQGIIF